MKISSAEFITSNTDASKCPKPIFPEYAFIGRSNVGKSSLINMLCDRKELARTSATPGKTTLINHYIINKNWYLVDLPGYGFAKTSKERQRQFEAIITSYLVHRDNLQIVFVLIDSRHPLQKIDEEFINWLGEKEIPFAIIYTKLDKLKKSEIKKNIKTIEDKLLTSWEELPATFHSSAEKKIGRDEILNFIDNTNKEYKAIHFTSE